MPMIAIVDDDASLRTALLDLMESLGIPAVGFPDAESFLQSEERNNCECLIADIHMPGLSGLELFQRLAKTQVPVPTILMTAYPDEHSRARAAKTGVVEYLTKPFQNEALIALVSSILRKTRSEL